MAIFQLIYNAFHQSSQSLALGLRHMHIQPLKIISQKKKKKALCTVHVPLTN